MLSRITTAQPVCPISNSDLMDHLAVIDPDQEELVAGFGLAATSYVEDYLGQLLVQRSAMWVASRAEDEGMDQYFRGWLSATNNWQFSWNGVGNQWTQLPLNAVSVASVSVGSWGSADQVLSPGTDYNVDLLSDPARIRFNRQGYGFCSFQQHDHLVVNFTAGMASDPTMIPSTILVAIKMITAALWRNRGDEGSDILSPGVAFLLANYRRPTIGGR